MNLKGFRNTMMLGVILFTGVAAFYTAEGTPEVEVIDKAASEDSAISSVAMKKRIGSLRLQKINLLSKYNNTSNSEEKAEMDAKLKKINEELAVCEKALKDR